MPGQPRPVPRPPGIARPGPAQQPARPGPAHEPAQHEAARHPAPATHESAVPVPPAASPFADLDGRPVAEHVGVFEAEHERLQRELSTIDQL